MELFKSHMPTEGLVGTGPDSSSALSLLPLGRSYGPGLGISIGRPLATPVPILLEVPNGVGK